MAVKKFVSKIYQSLPSWEMTKYYGRVAWFQWQCIKYRIQTSETWFNLMMKFMPGRLKGEAECKDKLSAARDKKSVDGKLDSEKRNESLSNISKSNLLMEKVDKFRIGRKKKVQRESLQNEDELEGKTICVKAKKKAK